MQFCGKSPASSVDKAVEILCKTWYQAGGKPVDISVEKLWKTM
jgi:hypothetical protein